MFGNKVQNSGSCDRDVCWLVLKPKFTVKNHGFTAPSVPLQIDSSIPSCESPSLAPTPFASCSSTAMTSTPSNTNSTYASSSSTLGGDFYKVSDIAPIFSSIFGSIYRSFDVGLDDLYDKKELTRKACQRRCHSIGQSEPAVSLLERVDREATYENATGNEARSQHSGI